LEIATRFPIEYLGSEAHRQNHRSCTADCFSANYGTKIAAPEQIVTPLDLALALLPWLVVVLTAWGGEVIAGI
jgi:hypothetical protein